MKLRSLLEYIFIVKVFDFLVSTKCKAILTVASFRNSSAQFFKSAWCSNFSYLSIVNIMFYFSLLETVLRECPTFLFFRRSRCSGR